MSRRLEGIGPHTARVMLVGDWPSHEEVTRGDIFSAGSGAELTKMLHEAGMIKHECYITNVCKERPPEYIITACDEKAENIHRFRDYFLPMTGELDREIASIRPNVVVTMGNLPLWALTGETSTFNWRCSELDIGGQKVIPTYHPATILRAWDLRPTMVHDLRKVKRESASPLVTPPNHNIEIFPSFDRVHAYLDNLLARAAGSEPLELSCDFETIRHCISCLGIATSPNEGFVIPIRTKNEYWTEEQLVSIVWKLKQVLEHKNVWTFGQNYSYDLQYFMMEWGINPQVCDDTMVQQAVAWPGMPKKLFYLAAMYCEHYAYWKDDLKDYKKAPENDEKYFLYNGRDVCYTYEVRNALRGLLDQLKLSHLYRERMDLHHALLNMTLKGCKIDKEEKKRLSLELFNASQEREKYITDIVGYFPNPKSPKQMQQFLYEDLGLPVQYNRKGKRKPDGSLPITANFEALEKLADSYPLVWPISNAILEMRSLGTYRSTFVESELDPDGRMRSYFNPAGPETFRLSSAENSFGRGMNLQNIPSGNKQKTLMRMPNVKKLFIPDEGYEIADVDLAGADAQVVAWEAGDEELKAAFRAGVKIHAVNAKTIFGGDAGPDGKKEPYYTYAKQGVHATNYGAWPKTVAAHLGITVREAERFQKIWFEAHPKIKLWHQRVENLLMTKRMAINAFGYRIIYLGRLDKLLNEALAWGPQSSVAIVSLRGLTRVDRTMPEVDVLIQVHDSLVLQWPRHLRSTILPKLQQTLAEPIPYPDPLTIQYGLKISTKSWGDCVDYNWDGTPK